MNAHEEQDDAEGGHRDWEEDPLGFDTNLLYRAPEFILFEGSLISCQRSINSVFFHPTPPRSPR